MVHQHDPPPVNPKKQCSDAQLRANRANAQLSTGPRTPEGKIRASLNNYQHGRRAKALLIPGERPEQLEQAAERFVVDLGAATAPEVFQAQSAAELAGPYHHALVANAGATRQRIQQVKDQFDDHGAADTDYLVERFQENPAAQLRTLKATPRGTQAVLDQWVRLDQELDHAGQLQRSDVLLGIRLMGKRPNQVFTDTDVTCWFIAALATTLTTSSDAEAFAVAKRLLGQEWPPTMDAREQEGRLRGLVAGRMGQDEAMAVYQSIIGEQIEGLTAHLETITRKEKKA